MSICSNLRLECVGPFHPISPEGLRARGSGHLVSKKEAFDFFASTEGGAYSETPTKCEHICIRMPTSTLDPVSAGNMTARKRHLNLFLFFLFKRGAGILRKSSNDCRWRFISRCGFLALRSKAFDILVIVSDW